MKELLKDLSLILRGLKEIQHLRAGFLSLTVFRSVFQALSPFVDIYMAARIINGIVEKKTVEELLFLALITIILNLIIAFISAILNRIINLRQLEFDGRYEMGMNLKTISLDYATIEDHNTHRARQKIDEYRNMYGGGLWKLLGAFQNVVKNFFTIIFSIALTISLLFTPAVPEATGFIVFIASPWFSVLLLIGIILNVFISMRSNSTMIKKMHSIMSGVTTFNRVLMYYIETYISNYHAGKDIRMYKQHNLIKNELAVLFLDMKDVLNRISRNNTKYTMFTSISTILLSTITYLFVGLRALIGIFGVGSIVQYIGSINQFTTGFTSFMTEFAELRANNGALGAYFEFMDIPSKVHTGTLPVQKNTNDEYEIEFCNVSFKYSGTEVYALKNLSIKIQVGKRMAIVGMNGSGKTTMIKLLCRLYDPTEGEILLNGINITEYDHAQYMSIFSVVFQDFKLFSFSLGQNIATNEQYDENRVTKLLEKAGFAERLNAMPKRIETPLYKDFDDDGVEISGGEAQKIALARALYKDAPFIVLDEPTAALDPIAEADIYSKFNEIVGNKTAIYISHRLSSCRFCDKIAVFHEGELIQYNDHDSLILNKDGKYYELWNAQAQYYVST